MPKHIELTGQKLGRLTVVGKKKVNGLFYWDCICDCGETTTVVAGALTRKHKPTRSCGCIHRETIKANFGEKHACFKHGHSTGYKRSKALSVWSGMMRRCYKPKEKAYKNYGARGITVCDRWHKFENFLEDMGQPPEGLTIERIDNEKGYSPENCRWATPLDQVLNRRANLNFTINGKTKILSQWAEEHGINYFSLYSRVKKLGWEIERAIETPFKKHTT